MRTSKCAGSTDKSYICMYVCAHTHQGHAQFIVHDGLKGGETELATCLATGVSGAVAERGRH
jgi:hypothetical protein